jgi:DNA-directed RNA polymerase subunit RPC12/RpoP
MNCRICGLWCEYHEFSRSQINKRKGGGAACTRCLSNPVPSYQCTTCYRLFNTESNLLHHMQVHRPKNLSCPVCGDCRFASASNAVAHVETGHCAGCTGKDNARLQIYQFVQSRAPFMCIPQIGYDFGVGNAEGIPDKPYRCSVCAKKFGQLSSLMNHKTAAHTVSVPLMLQLEWR